MIGANIALAGKPVYTVYCDDCSDALPSHHHGGAPKVFSSFDAAEATAKECGWSTYGYEALCPRCAGAQTL